MPRSPNEEMLRWKKQQLKCSNYRSLKERCFQTKIDKSWVTKYYSTDLDEIVRGRKSSKDLMVIAARSDPAIIIMPYSFNPIHQSFDIADFFRSNRWEKLDDNTKVFFLYSRILGKFIGGETEIPFVNIKPYNEILKKAVEPFNLTGFVSPLKGDTGKGIDFENSKSGEFSIEGLFGVIKDYLQLIDDCVTEGLRRYVANNKIDELKKCKETLMQEYDTQVEMYMWGVLRKISRQLNFGEAREELTDPMFYIILAADAKLLERYKDNYIEILNIFEDCALPNTFCRQIATLMNRTFELLKAAIEILLKMAYVMSPTRSNDTIIQARKLKEENSHKMQETIKECEKLGIDIDTQAKVIRENLITQVKSTSQNVVVDWIWGYSRILDRLNRHRKRVLNILQSGSFGIPLVD